MKTKKKQVRGRKDLILLPFKTRAEAGVKAYFQKYCDAFDNNNTPVNTILSSTQPYQLPSSHVRKQLEEIETNYWIIIERLLVNGSNDCLS